jgi:hypothetical protein
LLNTAPCFLINERSFFVFFIFWFIHSTFFKKTIKPDVILYKNRPGDFTRVRCTR